jgi:hypothetical protein
LVGYFGYADKLTSVLAEEEPDLQASPIERGFLCDIREESAGNQDKRLGLSWQCTPY